MAATIDPEVLDTRRAFATAQLLLSNDPPAVPTVTYDVGWHGTSVEAEDVALVALGGPLEDLVGEVVAVYFEGTTIVAYVYGRAALPVDLTLPRRSFLALASLATESLRARVGIA